MKSEKDPDRLLQLIKESLNNSHQLVFIGVIDVNNKNIESIEEVTEFIEKIINYLPINQVGVCDDCGFSPFCDDVSTDREIAFKKVKVRNLATQIVRNKLST